MHVGTIGTAAAREHAHDCGMDEARRRAMARRIAPFTVAWIASFAPWCGLLVSQQRLSIGLAVLVLAAHAAVLLGAGALCRRNPDARSLTPLIVGACVLVGVTSVAAFAWSTAGGEVLAFILLTLYLAAALFFAWGWRCELVLLALTSAAWIAAVPSMTFRLPPAELVTAIVIGSVVALAIAEAADRAFRTAWAQGDAERRSREALVAARDDAEAARREAEAATLAKDEFLAAVSHELRSPLHAVLTWISTLRDQRADARTVAHALEVIERNARAQARLIDDLLDVSRIASGKMSFERALVDVAGVVSAVVDIVRSTAAAKQVELDVRVGEDAVFVHGDAVRLQQVVENLMSNAVKFTPRGGRVTVAAATVGTQVEICVTDTGMGIPRDRLAHVFDRYEQIGERGARHGGLGLGLAIVREIVAAHGGTVEASSEGSGRGATFCVRLPASLPPSARQAAPANDVARS